jgi:hypothetical protein
MDESKNISIAEHEFIDWIDFDASSVNPKNIDELIEPTAEFWQNLEIKCVAECCGIDAFSFWTEDIKSATENSKISNLVPLIDKAIVGISNLEDDVIVSSQINQLISKQVFLKLLKHIRKNIKST